MAHHTELTQQLAVYRQHHPAEATTTAPLAAFLQRTAAPDRYRRTNFDGHVTASAFVLDVAREAVLLIHHRALDRWLQPGGHVDPDDASVLAAALREVGEELGIEPDELRLLGDGAWLDIDSHDIPAHPRKTEPAHVHHDLRWAFAYEGEERAFAVEKGAVGGYRWLGFGELAELPGFARVAEKLRGVST